MTIKSKISIDVNGNVILEMQGGFDYEYSLPLNTELKKIMDKHSNSNIIIDLNEIDFVGSSGISDFVQAIKDINEVRGNKVKLKNVKSEFKRVFKLYNLDESFTLSEEFTQTVSNAFEESFDNDETENLNQKRTFEN